MGGIVKKITGGGSKAPATVAKKVVEKAAPEVASRAEKLAASRLRARGGRGQRSLLGGGLASMSADMKDTLGSS